jgi:predicted N-acetyltransferase YhbS
MSAAALAPSAPHAGAAGSRSEPGEGAAFTISAETAAESAARDALLDRVMGSGRKRKSSEKLRRGRRPSEGLALVARDQDGRLVGTVRLWDVATGDGRPALLLGPLAVDNSVKSAGIGKSLMRTAIAEASRLGHKAILLVGDAGYYSRFGFSADKTGGLSMPGPYERERFLALELEPGHLDAAVGVLRATGRREKAARIAAAA